MEAVASLSIASAAVILTFLTPALSFPVKLNPFMVPAAGLLMVNTRSSGRTTTFFPSYRTFTGSATVCP